MSHLKPGTLCVIVGGCPENIGLVIQVIYRIGRYEDCEDAYAIQTVTSRQFNQLWDEGSLVRGSSTQAITDRHKLRPLVSPGDETPISESVENLEELAI